MEHRLAEGLWQLDTRLGGFDAVNASFLVEGERPCLVETGPQLTAGVVRQALARRGLGPQDLATVVLTHIHLDHGGGAGEIAAAFPRARVLCHPRGARHLADPTRLVAAAAAVYGPALDTLYGRMTPVPADRVVAAPDGQRIDIGGGRWLRCIHSPGHAKHHLAVLDERSGTLLVGDAVGVRIPGAGPLRPSTPPDDFDRDQAIASLRRFAAVHPTQVVLSHFGPAGDPPSVLADAEEQLMGWCAAAAAAVAEVDDLDHDARALEGLASRDDREPVEPDRERIVEMMSGVRSNAAGLLGWLRRPAGGAPAAPSPAWGGPVG